MLTDKGDIEDHIRGIAARGVCQVCVWPWWLVPCPAQAAFCVFLPFVIQVCTKINQSDTRLVLIGKTKRVSRESADSRAKMPE